MFTRLADPLGDHQCIALCGVLSEESHVIELWGEEWSAKELIIKCMHKEGYKVLNAHKEADMRPPADGVSGYDYLSNTIVVRSPDKWVGWVVTIEKEAEEL